MHGALQDITDRKRAEEELRQVAGRLATTLESIADGFFTLDRDWRFTYVNAEAEKLMRRDRDSLLGTTLWDAFPEAPGSVFEREYRRAVAEQNSLGFEQFFAPLNKWFAVRVYPSEQGCTVYFRDVTASHEAQKEVRLSEERFRLVSKATNDVVWETDLVTGTQSWNEGLTTLFGYDASEIERHDRLRHTPHPSRRRRWRGCDRRTRVDQWRGELVGGIPVPPSRRWLYPDSSTRATSSVTTRASRPGCWAA